MRLELESAYTTREEAEAAIAFLTALLPALPPVRAARDRLMTGTSLLDSAVNGEQNDTPETPAASTTRVVESDEQAVARRERGKPAPGRARRTKEEIAEDEAADKRDAEQTSEPTQQAISTGENRVGPEDDPETQAQDKADETAEADAKREEAAPLTIMDGKAALGDYINKFSMAAAQEDGPKIFVSVLGPVPDGAAGWTWPLALEKHGQSGLDKVIGAWRAAAAAEKRFGA
jgi:hypothetical protein